MPQGSEERHQDAMYTFALEEANQEQEDLQNTPAPETTRSDSSSLGIVRVLLQRDGLWFWRFSLRDQFAISRYLWFSLNGVEQSLVP